MNCPVDNTTLVMTDRSGVEIDYCPKCRGVWLDRGELDKINERLATESGAYNRQQPERRNYEEDDDHDHGHAEYRDRGHDQHQNWGHDPKKKKRGSFLEDVFGGFGD